MTAVNLDELAHAALIVDDGEGSAHALVARDTGMIHLLNDDYMDEEAPLPAEVEAGGKYVSVPAAGELGLGDELVLPSTWPATRPPCTRCCAPTMSTASRPCSNNARRAKAGSIFARSRRAAPCYAGAKRTACRPSLDYCRSSSDFSWRSTRTKGRDVMAILSCHDQRRM
jgi:hypothetical protein